MQMIKNYDISPISFLVSMMLFIEECRSEMLYLLANKLADKVIPLPSPRSLLLLDFLLLNPLPWLHFLMCFSRVLGILNGISQYLHFMMSFPVRPWVFMCLVSLLLWAQE